MPITIRYFASLREQLGCDGTEIAADGLGTITDVWQSATGQAALPDSLLCARNQQHAQADDPVEDGDEIAFFPPVTGG